jgi:predicted transcriptional regulator
MSDTNDSADASENAEPSQSKESSDSTDAFGEKVQDLRNRFKHLTQPFVDSLDSRLRDQIDRRVDDRVDDRVQTLVDEALAARLSVIERAIADIDRVLKELQAKLP